MKEQLVSPNNSRLKRPKILTIFNTLFSGFAVYQLFSFSQILFNWQILNEFSSVSVHFLAAYRIVMGGVGIWIATSLWTAKNWGRIGCMAYGIIFSIASWIKLIWIYEPTYLQTRWPANLAFTLLGLGILIGILNLKSTRAYFGKNTVKIP